PMNKIYTLIILVVIVGAIYYMRPSSPPVSTSDNLYSTSTAQTVPITTTNNQSTNLMHTITLETNKGTIVFETFDADAPKAVSNFITLANKNYYDGIIFHRVIQGFMIQGGDPTGTGRGGPGYTFADELDPSTESYKTGYVRGTVAMANAGPNTNGSQFFIMHKDNPLPNSYTIFGRVISGMEVVDAIADSTVDGSDRPLEKIVINKAVVSEKK
ncbi:MAG: peptidyl-prolyl cis-trans isomerase, partial [Patescibacteria group bacterium]|nr:peptidyl-prolyl cis-trans isomerase [Patescibacteria group bacterium]